MQSVLILISLSTRYGFYELFCLQKGQSLFFVSK